MRVFILFLILISTVTANASFSGKWSGPVNYSDSDGNVESIDQNVYFYPYAQDKVYFSDVFWGYQFDLEIKNGDLYVGDVKYGTISENEFNLHSEADGCIWNLKITKNEDGQMNFDDGYSCDNGYFDKTDGVLSSNSKGTTKGKSALKKSRKLNKLN